ncbi:uncharacterized protein [Palaemon carinicauda]|uniref:uncharacterized protein n=1 Tax=Palaemon carinicauda TaxID=392227 RepID=UPI0035B5A058
MIEDDSDVDEPMEEEVNEDLLTVHEFWRKFTVKHAVDHLMKAWEGLNVATIRHGWLKLAPHLVPPITQPIQQSRDVLAAAVQEARLVPGFGDVAEDDLLEIHAGGEEATEEDIISAAAVEDTLQQEPQQQPTDDAAPKDLSMHQVSSILAVIDILKSTIAENEVHEGEFGRPKPSTSWDISQELLSNPKPSTSQYVSEDSISPPVHVHIIGIDISDIPEYEEKFTISRKQQEEMMRRDL